jgi:hypothetical protein
VFKTRRFVDGLKRRARAVEVAASSTAGKAQAELKGQFDRTIWPAKKINKQDAPGGREFFGSRARPIRLQASEKPGQAVVRFSVKAYWTAARTAAIKAVLTSLGLIPSLFRKALIVGRRVGNRSVGPYRKVILRSNPRLAGWASRADRGTQYLAHVIRRKGQALRRISVDSALRRAEPKIMDLWRSATRNGLK